MRVIFLSEKRAALTVSGLYLGLADGFERSVELDPAEKHFIELKPEGFHAVRFRLDDDFLTAPPPQVGMRSMSFSSPPEASMMLLRTE